jgi:hypothetical protein
MDHSECRTYAERSDFGFLLVLHTRAVSYVAQPPAERVIRNLNSLSERCARPLAERDASEFMINGILMKCDTVGL